MARILAHIGVPTEAPAVVRARDPTDDVEFPDIVRLQERLGVHKTGVTLFISRPDVPATNNALSLRDFIRDLYVSHLHGMPPPSVITH